MVELIETDKRVTSLVRGAKRLLIAQSRLPRCRLWRRYYFLGTVFFGGGLANGATAYFALEGELSSATFTAVPNATPLPAALSLFAGGLGVMGWLGRRRKRKAPAIAA
jgi:hypothetical protein